MKTGSIGSMKSLSTEIERLKFDKRLVELNLNRKRISKDEYKKHLESLTDLSDNVAKMDLDEHLN